MTRTITRSIGVIAAIALGLSPSACADRAVAGERNVVALQQREARYAAALARGDLSSDQPIARWILPAVMSEISGLVLTKDGRLLAHVDEHATITEIDYKRGVLVKNFLLGDKPVREDFEGITRVGDRFYMMTSDGHLYEFAEGADKAQVAFRLHDSHLGKECELEGVAYDSTANALVMPCKVVRLPELEGQFVMYRWSLDSLANPRVSKVSIPLQDVIGAQSWKDFHASDITVDPKTGNYVLVAAQERALVVMTPSGTLVSARTLDDMHNQAEGVAITRDGVLIISDEVGKQKPAAITLYRWK